MNGSDRLRRGLGAALITTGLFAAVAALAQPATAAQTATQTVPLHNDEAGFEDDCPDASGDYWHFIIAPNNTFEFIEITLNVGGTTVTVSGAAIIPNGGQLDNVFVRVPDGAVHDDLATAGSFALITPDTRSVRFVLSHLCTVGTTVTTTTTTSTTTPVDTTTSTTTPVDTSTSTTTPVDTTTSTTTTTTTTTPVDTSTSTTTPVDTSTSTTTPVDTSTSTTTTVASGAVTTTTDLSGGAGGGTTTTVASGGAGGTTTTIIGSAGPTSTVASGAVTTIAPAVIPLPATGSDLAQTLGVLALSTLSVGGVLLLVARRVRPV